RLKRHEEFKTLVGWLRSAPPGTAPLDDVQKRLSLLADCCARWVGTWTAPAATPNDVSEWAIVALGKLGGSELTVHSDLDLVFVYEDDQRSRPDLEWQKFVERFQHFLAAPTSEGSAYRIDTRLRPEGTKGPLAIPFSALSRYLRERAEGWERLAWT